jgi:secondary thiamine-phosphate synthase enzyme
MFHRVIEIRTRVREELIDVTERVQSTISATGGRHGVVTLFVPHTTAAITLNENWDPDVQQDILDWLRGVVPRDGSFRHAEGNSDAHIKASLFGPSVQLVLVDGRLRLGRWQGIYFCEFDGPRQRHLEVALIAND